VFKSTKDSSPLKPYLPRQKDISLLLPELEFLPTQRPEKSKLVTFFSDGCFSFFEEEEEERYGGRGTKRLV